MFVSFKSNTTVSLVEQELPTTEGAHEFTTGSCCSICSCPCSVLSIISCPFVLLLLDIIKFVIKKEYDFVFRDIGHSFSSVGIIPCEMESWCKQIIYTTPT